MIENRNQNTTESESGSGYLPADQETDLPRFASSPALNDTQGYFAADSYTHNGTPKPPSQLYHETAARVRARRRSTRRNQKIEWAWVIIAVTLLIVIMVVGVSIVAILRNGENEQNVIPTADANVAVLPTAVNMRTENNGVAVGQSVILDDGSSIILQPWDGQSRFTVLLVGLDRRPGETGLAYRTDTMLLFSLEPSTNTLGILSIPRDLYVEVPGYSQRQRVNSAMVLGEIQQPGYGPTLAMMTIQRNLGIRVHEYLAVDFQAFIDLVDAIGGIEVSTEYTINDRAYPDMNFGYDPFYLPAGTHQLNGYDALRFARTRHGDNDIERAKRQQQTIFAIRDRILNFEILPQLIVHAPSLLRSWEDNVYTGLSLDQMIQLALYLREIPTENMRTGVIDFSYIRSWRTNDGSDVLILNQTTISNLMAQVFGVNYAQ
jgi:LCP family protein required for cell wall assembly